MVKARGQEARSPTAGGKEKAESEGSGEEAEEGSAGKSPARASGMKSKSETRKESNHEITTQYENLPRAWNVPRSL